MEKQSKESLNAYLVHYAFETSMGEKPQTTLSLPPPLCLSNWVSDLIMFTLAFCVKNTSQITHPKMPWRESKTHKDIE
jgi:hypothetical protein